MSTVTCPTCRRRPSERNASLAQELEDSTRHESFSQGPPLYCPDPIHDLADAAPERIAELEKEVADRKEDYERACGTVAKMHNAATGEVCAPTHGVVEDVAALRAQRDELLKALRFIIAVDLPPTPLVPAELTYTGYRLASAAIANAEKTEVKP